MSMNTHRPLINMFWYGDRLPALHRMCVASFLRSGHPVDLYCYDPSLRGVPDGVQLRNADDILNRQAVFAGRQGSYALFADQFRYELLHRIGGWWSDCDVYCVRPFSFEAEYVFGYESPGKINNAVIKTPPQCPLTRHLVESAKRLPVHRNWGRATRVFHDAVESQGLTHAALPRHVFYPVHYNHWSKVFQPGRLDLPQDTHALHLWGEMIRRKRPGLEPPFDVRNPIEAMWRQTFGRPSNAQDR